MKAATVIFLILAAGLGGCTAQQRYALGQDFRNRQCDQTGGLERVRCTENAAKPFDQYEAERRARTER